VENKISSELRATLIEAARSVYGEFRIRRDFSAASVGAALLTEKGNIYTGICIDLASGLGFCAEVSAIAEMLKSRETCVIAIVAVSGDYILPPCGRCREMLAQIDEKNFDCQVILRDEKDLSLRDLLPQHWLLAEQWE
jgi:cytidine deaminase